MNTIELEGFESFHRRDYNSFAGAVAFPEGQAPLIKYVSCGAHDNGYTVIVGGSEEARLDCAVSVIYFDDDTSEVSEMSLMMTSETTIQVIVEHLVTLDRDGAYSFLESLGGVAAG